VLLYRVFPYLRDARGNEPGHPLYANQAQGSGRWDNPGLYSAFYLAKSPEAAIGEAFGNLLTWTPAMFASPVLKGAERSLCAYDFDEAKSPLIDFDDPGVLCEREIRPTHVVICNRPRTQKLAAEIYGEGKWSGICWWSHHLPEWGLVVLFGAARLTVVGVEQVAGQAAFGDAAVALSKLCKGF